MKSQNRESWRCVIEYLDPWNLVNQNVMDQLGTTPRMIEQECIRRFTRLHMVIAEYRNMIYRNFIICNKCPAGAASYYNQSRGCVVKRCTKSCCMNHDFVLCTTCQKKEYICTKHVYLTLAVDGWSCTNCALPEYRSNTNPNSTLKPRDGPAEGFDFGIQLLGYAFATAVLFTIYLHLIKNWNKTLFYLKRYGITIKQLDLELNNWIWNYDIS